MTLTYRLHTTADEPALRQLWTDHGGWDAVSVDAWEYRMRQSPHGLARIVVGEEKGTGRLLTQFAFIPSLLIVDGREVTALRPFAPIVSPEGREQTKSLNPFDHPVAAMYNTAVRELRERGDGLIYMMPDPRWARFFRMFPFLHTSKFPLFSRSFDLPVARELPEGFTAAPSPPASAAIDALWSKASKLSGCQVVRDSRMLPWKIGAGDYEILGVHRGDELVGLVASRQKGDRQWLICDLIAADNDHALTATLMAATRLGAERAEQAPAESPIRKAAVLATPSMEPTLKSLGFLRDDYDFSLVVHILDPSLSGKQFAQGRWYLSAND